MGVYIKGIKIPKECRECYLLEYYEYLGETQCSVTRRMLAEREKPISFDGRPDWCPLVEIPEPHGRLIDEDNVIDAVHERLQVLQTHKEFIKKRGDIDLLGVLPYISKIQTVIEAEGE